MRAALQASFGLFECNQCSTNLAGSAESLGNLYDVSRFADFAVHTSVGVADAPEPLSGPLEEFCRLSGAKLFHASHNCLLAVESC